MPALWDMMKQIIVSVNCFKIVYCATTVIALTATAVVNNYSYAHGDDEDDDILLLVKSTL